MDGHRVVAFSAAVITLWGLYRFLESSTRRRAENSKAVSRLVPPPATPQATAPPTPQATAPPTPQSNALPTPQSAAPPPPTPQKAGTLPSPPTPAGAQVLSPASIPTLQTLPTVPETHVITEDAYVTVLRPSATNISVSTTSYAPPPPPANIRAASLGPARASEDAPADIPVNVSNTPVNTANTPLNMRIPSIPPSRSSIHFEEEDSRMPETPMATTIHVQSLPVKTKELPPKKETHHEANKQESEEHKEHKNNHENKRALKPSKKQPASLEVASDSRVERIDCETLASWLTKGDKPVVVDVRTDNYKGGNITSGRHLAYSHYQTGKDFLEAIRPTKQQKIVFVCMYGKEQSPSAAQDFLAAADPAQELQVCVLHGGFQAWLRYCARADLSSYVSEYNQDFWVPQDGALVYRADLEGEPEPMLQRAPSLRHMRMQSSTLRLNLDENHRYEYLDSPTLGLWLASNDKPLLVDVRSEDFKGGHIAKAMHIPFASFSTRIGEVQAALRENTGERKNVVVFYCLFGDERSPTTAMKFLTKHADPSTKVYVLRRGFQDWLNFCLQTTPMSADRVVDYDPEKWVKQGSLGYVYKSNYSA